MGRGRLLRLNPPIWVVEALDSLFSVEIADGYMLYQARIVPIVNSVASQGAIRYTSRRIKHHANEVCIGGSFLDYTYIVGVPFG